MKLQAVPVGLSEAKEFIANFHRHNKAPVGYVFAVGASNGTQLVGVATAGRPVSRHLDNGETLEVTRCCVVDEAPKGTCSFLYARCWQAAKALGWSTLVTYTLQEESGASLRGAGWRVVATTQPNNPSKWQTRPGREWHPVVGQAHSKASRGPFRLEFLRGLGYYLPVSSDCHDRPSVDWHGTKAYRVKGPRCHHISGGVERHAEDKSRYMSPS